MVRVLSATRSGRARFRVRELHRSPPLKAYLERKLFEAGEVRHVSANAVTGNVLVLFSSERPVNMVAERIRTILVEFHYQNGAPPQPASSPPTDHPPPPAADGKLLPLRNQSPAWHALSVAETVASFGASLSAGLSRRQAQEALRAHGGNALPETPGRSRLRALLDQVSSVPVALLAAAAAVSLATGGLADAAAIVAVISLNAAIGFITEQRTERTIRSLRSLVRPRALVMREAVPLDLPVEEVVPGDLLLLRPGAQVAADARVVEAQNLSLDESLLTGESLPVMKSPLPQDAATFLADRLSMVYLGTVVTGGQGAAVVVATGARSEMGNLQALVNEAQPPQTPLERQLGRLGNQLVLLTGAVCGMVFFLGLIRGYRLAQMLKTSISLAVSAVPEGLPAVAITTLALGIRSMRRRRVLIRRLEAVETLGCVQTICLDKTGTITQNRMSVVEVVVAGRRLRTLEGGFEGEDSPVQAAGANPLRKLLQVVALCNETRVAFEGGDLTLDGSPTEKALVKTAIQGGVDVLRLRQRYPLLETQHRAENQNFMRTIHACPSRHRLLAVKGSPVEVLEMCAWVAAEGERRPLTEEERRRIESENQRLAGQALRVLGVAYGYRDPVETQTGSDPGLTWLGLIGMADPVRKGVKELIGAFHAAGIETVMITGDQTATAFAIGKELDLGRGGSLEILDSTRVSSLDPQLLKALALQVQVFSRVSPAHKLQIVQALQRSGKVVAMTGDGVNDGPALKAADIGIAMGRTGTDTARNIADVILADDDLETVFLAVSHGRSTYANIRKSLRYLLSTNLSEVILTFVTIALGLGRPLTTLQLLWINLISDIFPSLALALEPPEPGVMKRPPRDPSERVVSAADFRRISLESTALAGGALAAYAFGVLRHGRGPRAGTLAFQGLILGQLLHALSCRSEESSILDRARLGPNRHLHLAVGASLLAQVLTMLVPGLRRFLGLTAVDLPDGAAMGAGALLAFVANESRKSIARKGP